MYIYHHNIIININGDFTMSKKFFLLLICVMLFSMGVVSAQHNITSDAALDAVDDTIGNTDLDDVITAKEDSADAKVGGSNYGDIIYDDGNDFSDYVVLKAKNMEKTYSSSKTFNVKAVSKSDKTFGVEDVCLKLRIYDGNSHKDYYKRTDSNGVVKFKLPKFDCGKHKARVSVCDSWFKGKTIAKTVKITPSKSKVNALEITAFYKHSKTFKAKITNKQTKKPVKKIKVLVRVGSNKMVLKTDSKGFVKFKTKHLDAGKYGVWIASKDKNYRFKAKSGIVVNPLETSVKAKHLKATVKKSRMFKIKIVDRFNKKPVKKVRITVWVGAKKKTFITNSHGRASFDVRGMHVGTHRVHIKSGDSNYRIDHVSSIRIVPIKTLIKVKHFEKSRMFTIKVAEKSTKRPVKKIHLTAWFDGKKRTFVTNKKGLAGFSTRHMHSGIHTVQIKTHNPNYSIDYKYILKIIKGS